MFKSLKLQVTHAIESLLIIFGLPSLRQGADEVLIRDPNIGCYGKPKSADQTARMHWEFAAMSENAYQEGRSSLEKRKRLKKDKRGKAVFQQSSNHSAGFSKAAFDAAGKNSTLALPTTGWGKWDFPSKSLQSKMLGQGLYMEVLERKTPTHTIAVVFEGTNFFELQDWIANLRWFLRFIPVFPDQYVLVAQDIAKEFHDVITSSQRGYKIDTDRKSVV